MKRVLSVFVFAAMMAVAACASSGGRGAGEPGSSRDWIISAQLGQEYSFQSAHEVIRRLRPHWFEPRRAGRQMLPDSLGGTRGGTTEIHVYINGTQMGMGTEILRSYLIRDIESMQYLRPNDATIRFGIDHGGGAILVTTSRG